MEKTVEEIKEDLDLRQFVSESLGLSFNISEDRPLKILCPFHPENTPSCTVYKDRFFCFGCHKGGDIFNWLKEANGLEFKQALNLVKGQGTLLKQSAKKIQFSKIDTSNIEIIWAINADIWCYANRNKQENYIRGKRTFPIFSKLDIGLIQFLLANWTVEQLVQTGNFNLDESGCIYFRFKECAIIPLYNKLHKICGFAGRYQGTDWSMPKYINSGKNNAFVKQRSLWGWESCNFQYKSAYVVEGFFDALSLRDKGLYNVFSCMGVRPSKSQLNYLFHYFDSVIFIPDGDRAGLEAIGSLYPLHKYYNNLKFSIVPDGLDPDDDIFIKGRASYSYSCMNSLTLSSGMDDNNYKLQAKVKPYVESNIKAGYPHYNVIDWVCAAYPEFAEEIKQSMLTMNNCRDNNNELKDEHINSFIRAWSKPCKKVRDMKKTNNEQN